MIRNLYFILILLALIPGSLPAQEEFTYAEKLGYQKGDRVLILHVDDAGMSYDSNEGTIQALTKGIANSCSVMMPCPWVPGFVRFLKSNPSVDAGLHLTLTSEWKDYRWHPLTGMTASGGLTDREGAFWPSVNEVVENASADAVEKEIMAQINRARMMGFEPTHLDSHMGTLFGSADFFERYVRVGIREKIPVMIPAGHATLISKQTGLPEPMVDQIRKIGAMAWEAGLPVLDDLHNESYGWKPVDGKTLSDEELSSVTAKRYIESLKNVRPGITMVIMHCTAPTEVFVKISDSGPTRKGDLLAMLNPQLKEFILSEGFILTTWRELMKRRTALQSR